MPAVKESMRVPTSRPLLGAAVLLTVEGVVLIGLGVLLIVKTATSHPKSVLGALLGAALVIAAGAGLIALTRLVALGRRWARSPVVVLQVLWLPVGFSLAFQAGRPGYGVPLLVASVGVLALLAAPSARAAVGD